jgi:hypothetical protein
MIDIQMQRERTLDNEGETLNRVGWFLPPFASVGSIQLLTRSIIEKGPAFSQIDLQMSLAGMYSTEHLAAMVTERYPIIPYIQDYKDIIAEGVEAHFCGLDHVAVAGLLPVLEGAGKKLAQPMGVKFSSTGAFSELAAKSSLCSIPSRSLQKSISMHIPIAISLMTTPIVMAFCTDTTPMLTTVYRSIFIRSSRL